MTPVWLIGTDLTGRGAWTRVELRLTQDEARVLYDWLFRTAAVDVPVPFEDQAEQRVLWDMEAMLETFLPLLDHVDSTRPTYQEKVLAARARVRDEM